MAGDLFSTNSRASALRVLIHPPAPGVWNMAVDEALLSSAEFTGLTLRFYQWKEPTLSLGYFQALADRSLHVASHNCPVVRRGSGGGAIVHDRELTYSLVAPVSERLTPSAEKLYTLMHESLCATLAQWNIAATMFEPPLLSVGSPPLPRAAEPFLCFERRSAGDVEFKGQKICGSAQRRHRQRILQHGSLLLARSVAAPELAGMRELASHPPEVGELTQIWMANVAQRLQLNPIVGEFTPQESALVCEFEGKFLDPCWTSKR